jgi:hypothetical protein
MNVEFTLQNVPAGCSGPGCPSVVNFKLPCVTSGNLRRKSSYRCLRASNVVDAATSFSWVSFTCPSYVCAALTCICSYLGSDNKIAFTTCATGSVIDRVSNS